MKQSHTIQLPDGDEVTFYIGDFLDSELARMLTDEFKYGFENVDLIAELRGRGRTDLIPKPVVLTPKFGGDRGDWRRETKYGPKGSNY